jgi:UDP-galactopyranose mutase
MNIRKIAVVGAGLSGATIARSLLSYADNFEITVFEKQSEIGGNLREKYIDGTLVHEHGPHIFHTKSDDVWQFIEPFSEWEPYFHRVTAYVRGQGVPVPFNFKSIDLIYGDLGSPIKSLMVEKYGFGARLSILKLLEADEEILRALGNEIFNNVFKGYSEKQWGAPVGEVAKGVLSRVPVVASYDDRYFDDKYQFIPRKGYNVLIKNMFDDGRILIKNSREVTVSNPIISQFDHVFCTGAVDDFFNFKHGRLTYRSLEFKQIESSANFPEFPTNQTNFPNEFEFTRVTKYGLLASQTCENVYIAEYPKECSESDNKYYPVTNNDNEQIFKNYLQETESYPKISFCGRLADFKYYNMDQVIARAMKKTADYIKNQR